VQVRRAAQVGAPALRRPCRDPEVELHDPMMDATPRLRAVTLGGSP
jgi:hypothetical protein